ncbi:sugar ABC transporter ATP-binding protein [Ramlibacter sp. G-1-2-2]|uniref:Sugar ABC transporter ATP-binding protein n=1 Tax=Ramlibacter agri TaxID=2728837 RepID=A0A848H9V2_9BURK|nr:ATP-binding cassette domain-containing protein [Ramlibacter agri]NML47264.1 sugar ABC transporter ATP-binding protein [Ramlibacter agri]
MNAPGRPKGEYRSAQHGAYPVSALLQARDMSVRFGGLAALDGFSLAVAAGEIHGIIGPNGAGKTTAINALTGFVPRGGGEVLFDGRPLAATPHGVAACGIGRTFQSPTMFGALSAVENVMCGGHLWTRAGLFACLFRSRKAGAEERALREAACEWLQKVGFARAPDTAVGELPFGELRKLEIARALMAQPRLLILDEPTAGLTATEVGRIGHLLQSLRTKNGERMATVLIEHNVPLVFDLCERVTALDKGRIIACGTPREVRAQQAVVDSYLGSQAVTGASPTRANVRQAAPRGEAILEVKGLSAGYGRMPIVQGIDLTLHDGELVVLCGRNGAGKSTLLNALTGQPRPASGQVLWLGQAIERKSVSGIVRAGIGLVPQERGVIAGQSVEANLRLGTVGLRLAKDEFRQRREEVLERFPKLRQRLQQIAGTLSGGERQMLALAKVLIRKPRLLLLDEPTIGLAPTVVDELQRIVAGISASGIAVVVAEQNIGWVAPLAHRAYLLEGGRIVASGHPDEVIRREQVAEAYLGQELRSEPEEELSKEA